MSTGQREMEKKISQQAAGKVGAIDDAEQKQAVLMQVRANFRANARMLYSLVKDGL